MRQAPAVGVTLSGGGAWRAAQALLAALAAGVATAWLLLHGAQPAWPALVAALLAGALAWRLARPQPVRLAWDGVAWTLDTAPGSVDLMLDLQRWLLLRFRPAAGGRVRWLAVPDHEAGAARAALRAALYSRAVLPTPPAPDGRDA